MDAAALAHHEFGDAGGGGVLGELDGQARHRRDAARRCRSRSTRRARRAARRESRASRRATAAPPRRRRPLASPWRRASDSRAPACFRARETACADRDTRSRSTSRHTTWPAKSITSTSRLRRPTLMPIEYAPSARSAIGTDGWPILPRTRACFSSRPSSIRRSTIIDTVCVDSRVSRAISAFGSGPCKRIACSTMRSLNCRMPTWFEPTVRLSGERCAGGVHRRVPLSRMRASCNRLDVRLLRAGHDRHGLASCGCLAG